MSLFSTNCAPKGRKITAGVAQLVEHFLAKEDVASSSLVTRSNYLKSKSLNYVCFGQTEALLLRSNLGKVWMPGRHFGTSAARAPQLPSEHSLVIRSLWNHF